MVSHMYLADVYIIFIMYVFYNVFYKVFYNVCMYNVMHFYNV